MNAPSELNFEDMLRIRLEMLRREHRDLDAAIHALEETGRPDQLTLRRLKKQKLQLKDQMVKIEDQLIPDIIA
ncbi:MAG: YdcH family protein [Paracoccaceae bacterium]